MGLAYHYPIYKIYGLTYYYMLEQKASLIVVLSNGMSYHAKLIKSLEGDDEYRLLSLVY